MTNRISVIMKDLLRIFQMKVIYAHDAFKVASWPGCIWFSFFCYPGLPGAPTRLLASFPGVTIDRSNKNTQNMSQCNGYESVNDRRRANCRNPCIKCTPSAGDEPVEIGRSISRRNMQTEFSRFRFVFCHFHVPCH